MNWSLIPSPLITAAAGLVGVLVGSGISAWTTRRTHKERLAADQALAERKFEFDRALAERRIESEAAMAEKKFTLDRELAGWKRRAEFAEEILADFYEVRDIINGVRSPLIFAGEGATRQVSPLETAEATRALNAYYATIERLKTKDEFFAKFYAKRYRCVAYFGADAANPYTTLLAIQHRLAITARMLIETYDERREGNLRAERVAWRRIVSETGIDDPIPGELRKIVEEVETFCTPAIQGGSP